MPTRALHVTATVRTTGGIDKGRTQARRTSKSNPPIRCGGFCRRRWLAVSNFVAGFARRLYATEVQWYQFSFIRVDTDVWVAHGLPIGIITLAYGGDGALAVLEFVWGAASAVIRGTWGALWESIRGSGHETGIWIWFVISVLVSFVILVLLLLPAMGVLFGLIILAESARRLISRFRRRSRSASR